MNEILKSYIYKKYCLWEDMNMPHEPYVHSCKNFIIILYTITIIN